MADTDDNKDDPYSLTVSVMKDKLDIILHDSSTKYVYNSQFTPSDLGNCGFSNKQISNLAGVCKFIKKAKDGNSSLQFSTKIEKNVNMDGNNNDVEEIAIVKIVKEDEDFGAMEYVMKLKQKERKPGDILNDHINDIKKENNSLKNRIHELEKKYDVLKSEVSNMNEQKQEVLWRKAAYSNTDTGVITINQPEKCLVSITLPQKSGKYICRYSTEVAATEVGYSTEVTKSYWINFSMKLGNNVLAPKMGGLYAPNNLNNYYVPLSQSVVVALNGNENDQQRMLGLYHDTTANQTYNSGMKNHCLECYELTPEDL
eukprot:338139_1